MLLAIDFTYCAVELPATVCILGISSNVPGSFLGSTSCSLSCLTRVRGEDVILSQSQISLPVSLEMHVVYVVKI